MAKEKIKLPKIRAVYCQCRDVSVIGGSFSMPEEIVTGKDCQCDLKPLKGKVRNFKTQDMTVSEFGDMWDAYIYPEIVFEDLNENE